MEPFSCITNLMLGENMGSNCCEKEQDENNRNESENENKDEEEEE